MATEYIVAMTSLILFVILLLISAYIVYRRKTAEYEQRLLIEKMYSPNNIVKMEYDFVVYDKETERIIANRGNTVDQLTIAEIVGDDELFGKMEGEGVEEITGNYIPD